MRKEMMIGGSGESHAEGRKLLSWMGENLCSLFPWPNFMYINLVCNILLASASLGSYHTLLKSHLCCFIPNLISFLTLLFNMGFFCLFFPFVFFNCLCAVLRCPVNIYPRDSMVIEAQKKGKFGSYSALFYFSFWPLRQ